MATRFGIYGLLTMIALLAGCSDSHPPSVPEDLCQYVLSIDKDGRIEKSSLPKSDGDPSHQCDRVLRHMREFLEKKPNRGVVIFVHGGLNPEDTSLERAGRLYLQMQAEDLYPVFINWNSSIQDTYWQQATEVRQGNVSTGAGLFEFPLFFVAHVGRAFTRIPLTTEEQLKTWTDTKRWEAASVRSDRQSETRAAATQAASSNSLPSLSNVAATQEATTQAATQAIVPKPRPDDVFPILDARLKTVYEIYAELLSRMMEGSDCVQVSLGQDLLHAREWQDRDFRSAAAAPVKLVTTPLVDVLAKPAWDNMQRRTHVLFEGVPPMAGDRDFNLQDQIDHEGCGALETFMCQFRDMLNQHPELRNRKITLIGHSLGSMVINELLDRFGDIHYSNIVYMAPACTVRDCRHSVVPYLEREDAQGKLEDEKTNFYILCLHPIADDMEIEAANLPPRGSLLVWIDMFLADPETPMDRTLGRWDNVLQEVHVFNTVKHRVHIKSFDLLPDDSLRPGNPQKHGDFTLQRFWDRQFWEPDSAASQLNKASAGERDGNGRLSGDNVNEAPLLDGATTAPAHPGVP
jgi:pimeloyl-ACP methyl ester carboxylesterase